MRLQSPAFSDGSSIPTRLTADGANESPPLAWSTAPSGTKSLAIIVEDPDAPSGTFVHWLAWNIEPTERALQEGDAAATNQGTNGFGGVGWAGPSPPPGRPHRYVFKLYAL